MRRKTNVKCRRQWHVASQTNTQAKTAAKGLLSFGHSPPPPPLSHHNLLVQNPFVSRFGFALPSRKKQSSICTNYSHHARWTGRISVLLLPPPWNQSKLDLTTAGRKNDTLPDCDGGSRDSRGPFTPQPNVFGHETASKNIHSTKW